MHVHFVNGRDIHVNINKLCVHIYQIISVVVNVEGVCNSYYKQCYDFFGTSNT